MMISRTTRRIIAVFLLVAFAAWLIFTVWPIGGDTEVRKGGNEAVKVYEPRFKKEGELAFVEGSDTIRQLDIEIAETPEEISYGMMYRKSMDPNTGMLFLMGEERQQSFFMKNTYVPLDIIFINADQEVVSIQKNATPLDESSLPSEGPAAYVLEVKGGFSDEHGIEKGAKIQFVRD